MIIKNVTNINFSVILKKIVFTGNFYSTDQFMNTEEENSHQGKTTTHSGSGAGGRVKL